MRILGWILALSLVRAAFAASAPHDIAWTDHARRFTGESARVREKSIKALKADPNLERKLRSAYGTNDHFLALDVISVLRLRSLLPFLRDASIRDRTGFSYHVMNSLLTKKELPAYRDLYLERLANPKSSPAAKMAILDSLPRFRAEVPVSRLVAIFRDPSPEVRGSALAFARHQVLSERRPEYIEILKPAIEDDAFQVRLQALYFLGEIPKRLRTARAKEFDEIIGRCRQDPVASVRNLCQELAP